MALRPRTIRAKLLGVFFAVSVVPMVLLGVLFYESAIRAVSAMAGNRTVRIAQSVREELDARLERRVQDRLLVTNFPLQAFLAHAATDPRPAARELADLREYLSHLFLQYGDYYDEFVFADARGRPLLWEERSGASFARGESSSRVVRTLAGSPAPDVLAQGEVPTRPGVPAGSDDFRASDVLLFQSGAALPAGGYRLQVDPIEGDAPPAVSLLMPVQSTDHPDVRLGYLIARLRPTYLWAPDWSGRRFGERGELLIVTKIAEQVLYHTHTAWIGRRLSDVDAPLARLAGPVSTHGPTEWTWAEGHGARRVATVLDASVAPWKVVATAEPAEFVHEARRAALFSVGLAMFVLLLAGGVLALVSGRLSRSVKQVTAGAQRIAGGDLEGPPIEAETHDELETLAEAFNAMTTSLRRNIAMREQTAAELDALNRSLETRVSERTQELQTLNETLNRANEDLKALDRLKTNFLSTVSHEFKTPLTSIKAFAEILHDELDERGAADELKRFLRIIDLESDRLARLIKNVLDLSRLESGRLEWHMTDFPLSEVVGATLDGLLPSLREKSLRVERRLECPDALLHGDQDRIQEVLSNVLDNAIHASPPGGRLQIACRPTSSPEDGGATMLHLTIRDEGPGIPPDQLERVFDRFHQVAADGKRRRGGTGLGLAICREITEHHGGRIWAESEPGSGATFHVTLPLADARTPRTEERMRAARTGAPEGSPHD